MGSVKTRIHWYDIIVRVMMHLRSGENMVSSDASENVALVTKTLIYNGSSVAAGDRKPSLPLFMDLCSLCEATVLLDGLQAISSPDLLSGFDLGTRLVDAGLLREFAPRLSDVELDRLVLRLPKELLCRLLVDNWSNIDDLRDDDLLDDVGALKHIDYSASRGGLISSLDNVVSYPSINNFDPGRALNPQERIYRSNAYLLVSSANGLDYFPDFDRVPFVRSIASKLYQSMPRAVYAKVAEAIGNESLDKEQLINEWTLMSELPIPPVAALVLRRCGSAEDIPGRLLEVRAEFEDYRRHFRRLRVELRSADSIKERQRLRKHYQTLLHEASGPERETVTVTELLNFAESLVPVAMAPHMPTSYSAALLTQPIEWLRRWWLRRPLAVLFRLDSKLPRLHEYGRLVDRLWGEGSYDDLFSGYAAHSTRLKALMS